MPSFDIVSKLDLQEVENAVQQAKKEIITRYDFKDTATVLDWDREAVIKIESADEFKVKATVEVLRERLARRQVPLKALEEGKIEPASGGRAKQEIKLKQGIETDRAKEIVKLVKESKLKVQAQIQADQVRVTGKSRDDLQTAIRAIKARDWPLPLQFVNMRD